MNILSFSASHHDLDLDLLEMLGSVGPGLARDVVAPAPGIVVPPAGAVVLATCNRVEVYVEADDAAEATARVAAVVGAATGLPRAEVTASLTRRTGVDAARHLLRVASGLESMVVGEREIAGQVRRAAVRARELGTSTPALDLLFEEASRTSRRVEAATGLGAVGRSVVGVGLDLAGESLPPWRQVRAVLVGTGSYAGAAFAALRSRGVVDVRVHSRSGRAEGFAHARGGLAVVGDGLVDAVADADLVVSCSGRVGHVLDAAGVALARERATDRAERRAHEPDPTVRPLVILDLALRRDVEAAVGDVEGVLLLDLATIGAHAPAAGPRPVAHAEALVEEGVAGLSGRELRRRVDAAVKDEALALTAAAEREAATAGGDARAARRNAYARRHAALLAAKAAAAHRLTH
ncbi:glutamyl-tRNA reductase [Flavimobilis sp. GY10621]|uniref:Glutamyl-tRNA reductase n=1 Tax=Flavimobilis rhizosphaerae TaxID=2775421 RepID=A0ABR9DQY2_9MICO|nr:glutamyl-tRNA reductase [Flavimobilis rhizosphaerae]MBD9699526.1 glutamyl-tRNA reductase [Flavimobilis rhizosphaerae]